jgi:hypothetical protein
MVERFGATAIDYRAGDFVAAVRGLTAGRRRLGGSSTRFGAAQAVGRAERLPQFFVYRSEDQSS